MQSSPSARAISAGRATNSWSYWERSIRRLMRIHDPSIVGKLAELHVELQYGAALSDLTSLGIGGTTDLLRIKKHESLDRKSTRLNSSHLGISYAVFCLKKKNKTSDFAGNDTTTDHY